MDSNDALHGHNKFSVQSYQKGTAMQVLVSSKNFVVSEAIRAFAQEQADKLGRLSEKIFKVRLYLETVEKKTNDPLANRAQVVVEIPGADITVEKRAVEMYEAVLKAFGVAHRHVRKHHEKLNTKRRKSQAARG